MVENQSDSSIRIHHTFDSESDILIDFKSNAGSDLDSNRAAENLPNMAAHGSSSSKTNGLLPVAASQITTAPTSSRPGTYQPFGTMH